MALRIVSTTMIICLLILLSETKAQRAYPPQIEGAKEIIYKTVDDVQLKLWIFNPGDHSSDDKAPAIVFFFGGGWSSGSPGQFVKHCEYLSARGMVAIVADYRVRSRHDVLANKCVSDAKSAVRWIREHASQLGVDPNRIAAGGGSAGGHLAAACAILPKFDEKSENQSISSTPNALVLFNPAVILAPAEGLTDETNEKLAGMKERMGTELETISPYHNLTSQLPPTIIFHGIADSTVPFKTVELFTEKMKELGNECTLVGYKGEPHGFFNYGRNNNGPFVSTVSKMDEFLVSLGYLEAPPEAVVTSD